MSEKLTLIPNDINIAILPKNFNQIIQVFPNNTPNIDAKRVITNANPAPSATSI